MYPLVMTNSSLLKMVTRKRFQFQMKKCDFSSSLRESLPGYVMFDRMQCTVSWCPGNFLHGKTQLQGSQRVGMSKNVDTRSSPNYYVILFSDFRYLAIKLNCWVPHSQQSLTTQSESPAPYHYEILLDTPTNTSRPTLNLCCGYVISGKRLL